jgi:hypothetical protein
MVFLASPCAVPRKADIIPSVMMNGASFRRVMSVPLIRPQSVPTPIPASAASAGGRPRVIVVSPVSGLGTWCGISRAMLTTTTAIADPTDKSIPPAMMINVIPSAAVPTTAVWRRISSKFPTVQNLGRLNGCAEKIAITKISPMSGPSLPSSVRQSSPPRASGGVSSCPGG